MLSNFDQMNIENLVLISNEIYFNTIIDKGRVSEEDLNNVLNTFIQYIKLKDLKVDDVRRLLKSEDNMFMNDKCPEWFNDKLKQLEVEQHAT
jgi:hypothetical protein